ncbi:hypothetical protein D3C85_581810 [compost metagenome]
MAIGRILQNAYRDANRIVMQGGFQDDILISNPDNTITVSTPGFRTKHWINYDNEGNSTDTKNAHVCVSESDLVLKGITVRNNIQEVALKNYFVQVKDNTGILKKYVVRRNYPDETLGLIVLILGDTEQ